MKTWSSQVDTSATPTRQWHIHCRPVSIASSRPSIVVMTAAAVVVIENHSIITRRTRPVILESVRRRPEASKSSGSARLQVPQHQRHAWQYPAALERRLCLASSSHIFLKMSTAKKCSCLWKTSFQCFIKALSSSEPTVRSHTPNSTPTDVNVV